MLNGLDLFSGIGGLTLALSPYVRPVAYCDNERFCQAVLLSRMRECSLPSAPIWDDVRTLRAEHLPEIDIIYGGFPCQDISVAGRGKGLEGERSKLFFEILRLAEETKPTFIFLENSRAIRTRGLERVVRELSDRGYDLRWHTLSASQVGAPHYRPRWWLLAYARCKPERTGQDFLQESKERIGKEPPKLRQDVSDSDSDELRKQSRRGLGSSGTDSQEPFSRTWWSTEPEVGRVVHGVPFRVDRIRGLGNSVVPLQARTAFMRLMGITRGTDDEI